MHVYIEPVTDGGRTDEDGGGGGRKHSHKEPCYRPPLNKNLPITIQFKGTILLMVNRICTECHDMYLQEKCRAP